MLEPIHIPRIARAFEQTERLPFSEIVPDLPTLTPVQGEMVITHRGNFLEVSAQAEAIVTLTCDRCLQQYNHRLVATPSEIIWLEDNAAAQELLLLDQDLAPEDLVETLPPQGYFEPATWLYEQLCLALPQRKLCDEQCQGIEVPEALDGAPPAIDQRWARLESLKDQLFRQN